MADSSREIDDRVDFEDDNSEEEEEEMDDEEEEEEEQLDDGDEKKDGVGKDSEDDEKDKKGEEDVVGEDSKKKNVGGKHGELLALPPHGSEIFIGGLTREVVEEDLRDLCEPFGEVVEVKLVKNRDTNESKGFAFVAYRTKDVAQEAIKELHNKEYKGRTLRCSLSETKYRLFIGNVPKEWTEAEFKKLIDETGPGAELVELIKDPQNPSRNRGFAFVEYYNNACADYSRQKLASATFKFDGNAPTVTWADPKITPDHSAAASQVKALYLKNIPENTSTEQLKELFQRHGEVTKVVMPPAKAGGKRDFGFVHYAERSSALKAVKESETYEVNGKFLEVVLAKPQNERKTDGTIPHHAVPQPNYIPHAVYGGFAANPYAATVAAPRYGVTPSFQQPMIYGRGPVPGGMQMVPMVLPDGQIGYVLQQPGTQLPAVRPPRSNERGSSNGSRVARGRGGSGGGSDDSNRGRYRPY
uniref:heterogeneous nuclear ribonucleoprotein Q n=1 Tax=Erigeron canadensis TaxID=72917 RepID=UPI001CB8FC25|nr:heterogeneous nuclear ribonucleoprotein Q [Erigeron canadensis]XP_043624841.1 heterogeneous nuclear ribonucleoprotein Q [Erigeron canadensis]